MNNAALLRTLIVYAICVPLALLIGYWAVSLANAPTRSSFVIIGLVALALGAPIFLRWHHPLLLLCWSMPAFLFFLPGDPTVYLPMVFISLGISLLQRTVSRQMHFIHAPQVTLPFCVVAVVAFCTAKLTGGIGLHSLGNDVSGGKKYIDLWVGVLSYFALTARRIPPERVGLYVALFFLSACISVIGDLESVIHVPLGYFYLIFPADSYETSGVGTMRLTGLASAAAAVVTYMLVRYGIRGIFLSGKLQRLAVFMLSGVFVLFGGFRSILIGFVVTFACQFFLERLHRTKLLPVFLFTGILTATICFPFVNKLPYSAQRALSFLPLNIDPGTRADAQGSLDWRIEMWQALLPQVPKYLWLGKGYALTQEDWENMGRDTSFHSIDPAQQGLAISGDYHNGPLSVILPLGIWGVIAVIWLFIAGGWALRSNYRYGDPSLKIINTALLAMYISKVFSFLFIFGSITGDIVGFAGILGLSISLNNGICKRPSPAAEPKEQLPAFPRARLQPAFSK